MRVCGIGGEYLQPCFSYGLVKAAEGVIAEARVHSAKDVAEAWPDTEANEEVSLIRGIAVTRARVSAEKETIKDSYEYEANEGPYQMPLLLDCSLNILVSANGRESLGQGRGMISAITCGGASRWISSQYAMHTCDRVGVL